MDFGEGYCLMFFFYGDKFLEGEIYEKNKINGCLNFDM